MATYTSDGKI